jgi:hypothetical protein
MRRQIHERLRRAFWRRCAKRLRMAENHPIEQIRLLVTGGTIDKSYCPVEGALSFSRTACAGDVEAGARHIAAKTKFKLCCSKTASI